MKRLQVYSNGEWQYVFCRNERNQLPITTEYKLQAIEGDEFSLAYFQKYFGLCEFRII